MVCMVCTCKEGTNIGTDTQERRGQICKITAMKKMDIPQMRSSKCKIRLFCLYSPGTWIASFLVDGTRYNPRSSLMHWKRRYMYPPIKRHSIRGECSKAMGMTDGLLVCKELAFGGIVRVSVWAGTYFA